MNRDKDLKVRLHLQCLRLLEDRIAELKSAIEEVNQSASTEIKSSAGDKHETGRAMMHLERDRLSRQIEVLLQQASDLDLIDPRQPQGKAVRGSLVHTDQGLFYLAIGLGKVRLGKEDVVVLSIASPLGKQFLGSQSDDRFSFRGTSYRVLAID